MKSDKRTMREAGQNPQEDNESGDRKKSPEEVKMVNKK